ncbi:hypothetical protein NZL45_001956 [Escherichia coli]|uniref:hypothetical protein n=1 Tax=Escherichia coli TaxID=562 RepID=UPI0001F926E6|nr:hypothetical protein [Escherichia coli]EFA8282747.1 hypothetical protein [Escherichia coli O157]EEW4293825.1 hypothetical protein [Escherichia coli]EEZ5826709.1 hypothetical protein [Escherichia coli]EFG4662336.1 hypothetical protein [Escherichia coli]EFH7026433.1 hypothetical protein [Escherichia coli]
MSNYKPMLDASQGTSSDVLYIDANAPALEIWEAACSRIDAVRRLNNEMASAINDKMNHEPLAVVNSILLSDASFLFFQLAQHLDKTGGNDE